jgi:hypothetical protein
VCERSKLYRVMVVCERSSHPVRDRFAMSDSSRRRGGTLETEVVVEPDRVRTAAGALPPLPSAGGGAELGFRGLGLLGSTGDGRRCGEWVGPEETEVVVEPD